MLCVIPERCRIIFESRVVRHAASPTSVMSGSRDALREHGARRGRLRLSSPAINRSTPAFRDELRICGAIENTAGSVVAKFPRGSADSLFLSPAALPQERSAKVRCRARNRDFRDGSISGFFNSICAKAAAGVDVERTYRTAALDASIGRIVGLQESPREGPECAPKLPFQCEREIGFTARSTHSSEPILDGREGREAG